MEKFIKKFFDCFEEEIKKMITNINLEIENCNTNIMRAEYVLYKIKKENLSDDEYKKEYYSNQEYDIKIYEKLENENKEKKIKNENKLLMYENMMKILSIL